MKMTLREKDNSIQAIVSYKVDGKWRQKSKQGFKTQKEAKKWAENMMFELKEDERDNISGGDMTLQELIDTYLEHIPYRVKENTLLSMNKNIRGFEQKAEKIIKMPIKDIKPIDISNVFFRMKDENGYCYHGLSAKVKAMFNFAVRDLKAIRENPVKLIKNTREDDRIKYIDKELYQQILKRVSYRDDYVVFIKLLYNTGVRLREGFGLTIDNVFEDYIFIDKQWSRSEKFTDCKTKSSIRKIPITKELYDDLTSMGVTSIDGRLFHSKMSTLRPILATFNVSPHCFRHTFATNLVMMGANLKIASEIVGDSFDVFIKTYVHSSEEERTKTFDLVRGF